MEQTSTDETGVRAILSKKRGMGGFVAGGLVLAAGAVVYFTMFATGNPGQGMFWTSDDGKSYFDAAPDYPPLSKHGGEAVAARVYSCGGEPGPRVRYMEKYTPEGRGEARKRDNSPRGTVHTGPLGLLVKRPGDKEWLSADNPAHAEEIRKIKDVKCADGKPATQLYP